MKNRIRQEKEPWNEEEDDYHPTPPNGPETDTRNDTQKKQEEEQSASEPNIASELSVHTPSKEHKVQSEMGKSLSPDSVTVGK